MGKDEIEKIIEMYTKDAGFTPNQIKLITLMCRDVELEVRHKTIRGFFGSANNDISNMVKSDA